MNERVRFYLRHQAYIDEWSKLAAEASTAADEFFWSLGSDMDRLRQELGSDVSLERWRDNRAAWRGFMFYVPAWRNEVKFSICIGIEWKYYGNGLVGFRGDSLPSIEVWVDQSLPMGERLSEDLQRAFQTAGLCADPTDHALLLHCRPS